MFQKQIHCQIKQQKHKDYPENVAPTGPIFRIRVARDSPSFSGGGCESFSRFISLQVMRVGAQARPGGTITRIPEWRQPRIAPPRASTMKLTRNLQYMHEWMNSEWLSRFNVPLDNGSLFFTNECTGTNNRTYNNRQNMHKKLTIIQTNAN